MFAISWSFVTILFFSDRIKELEFRLLFEKYGFIVFQKEGKEMENDFLNTKKLNVNLNNYTNINLFYNYETKYSISLTESQQEIMFLIQSS